MFVLVNKQIDKSITEIITDETYIVENQHDA